MPERRDEFVQATNNSSIVSKRSVEELYGDILYPQQSLITGEKLSYFKYVVPKFKRRSPNVNRGYLLRLLIFKHAIRQILRNSNQGTNKRFFINLGCGFDPAAFEYLDLANRFQDEHYKDLVFVDIDYPELIDIKVQMIKQSEDLSRIVGLNHTTGTRNSLDPKIYPIATLNYIAVKCDLNNTRSFKKVLSDLNLSDKKNDSLKIFIAEVSITYMDPEKADAIIESAIGCENCHFLILEHLIANNDFDDKFVKRMLFHFNKINSPIKSVQDKYRTVDSQLKRYKGISNNKGFFEMVTLMNFWNTYLNKEIKQKIDNIEPFDEFEEFNLFCMHYYFGHYTNSDIELFHDRDVGFVDTDNFPIDVFSDITINFKIQKNMSLTQRRFAACTISDENNSSVLLNSGFSQTKLNSSVLLSNNSNDKLVFEDNYFPEARICHCITKLEDNSFLITGGRTAPGKILNSAWILEKDSKNSLCKWTRLANMHVARSRHNIFTSRKGTIFAVNGGKGAEKFDFQTKKWDKVKIDGINELNFKSAALAFSSNNNIGYMCGGMAPDGTISSNLYRLKLSDDEKCLNIELIGSNFIIGRYGAKLIIYENKLVLMGGVSEVFINDKSTTIIIINLANEGDGFTIGKYLINDSQWKDFPILVCGDLAVNNKTNEYFYVGGGIVCFSFGSYWNDTLQIEIGDICKPSSNIMKSDEVASSIIFDNIIVEQRPLLEAKKNGEKKSDKKSELPPPITIKDISNFSVDGKSVQILELIFQLAETPLIVQKLSLGECVNKWDNADYWLSKIDKNKQFKILESGDIISFNSYINSLFSTKLQNFLRIKNMGFTLGSLSSDLMFLEIDFPEVAKDFHPLFESHYEVLKFSSVKTTIPLVNESSNKSRFIILQIVGQRMVRMYPQSQSQYLGISGRTCTSNIQDIFNKNQKLSFNTDKRLTPYQGILHPGDVLFVPPEWIISTKVLGGKAPSVSIEYSL